MSDSAEPAESYQVPFATVLFILANAAVMGFEWHIGFGSAKFKEFIHTFGLLPGHLFQPGTPDPLAIPGFPNLGYLQLLTHQFLHLSWGHIGSNMAWLWICGPMVERRMGFLRFLIFYLICGVLAGWVQVLYSPHLTLPTVGASGAIAGVLGAYMLLFPCFVHVPLPFDFNVSLPVGAAYWVYWLYNNFHGVDINADRVHQHHHVIPIAFWAHIGGFTSGLLMACFFAKKKPDENCVSDSVEGRVADRIRRAHSRTSSL